MKTDIKNQLHQAYRGGLTDEKLEEFLSQYKPKCRDLSNPYRFYPEIYGVFGDRVEISCYTTVEMAPFECAILQAKRTLRIALDKERGDWRPDWSDEKQFKWYPVEVTGITELVIYDTIDNQQCPDWVYLPNRKAWLRVIEEVGEPCVKMALFEIEEDE